MTPIICHPPCHPPRRDAITAATRAALALLLPAWLACGGPGFAHPTPEAFVELPAAGGYAYRAVTADGVVLAVRAIEHEPRGTLAFWTTAIGNQMTRRAGYALLETREVKTAQGQVGTQLRFGHDEGNAPFLYYVTVLVTDDALFVLEAGGTADQMTKYADQIDAAVREFRVGG